MTQKTCNLFSMEYYCFRSFWMRSVLFLRAANGIIIGEKRTCHDCLNWFAKGLSQKHLYTHLSFSIGTLWKLKCPPFSKYWPHPLAMHLLPLLRGVVTSGLNGVVILYSMYLLAWLLPVCFANRISLNNWHVFCMWSTHLLYFTSHVYWTLFSQMFKGNTISHCLII